jgi:flagella basal body P-ring formation protein FlgA
MLKKIYLLALVFTLLLNPVFAAAEGELGTLGYQLVPGQKIADCAKESVRKVTGSQDVTITQLGQTMDLKASSGVITMTAEVLRGVNYNSPTNVAVLIKANGKVIARIVVRLSVKLYQNVVIISRPITTGSLLTLEDLKYERFDTGRLSQGYYTDINKLVGLVVRRPASPGTIVNDYLVDKPIIIKRGATVSIVSRVGTLEVSATGQAMQDGKEGQLIRVQNLSTKRFIVAKVLSENVVLVSTN